MDLRSLLKKLQDTVNTGISNIQQGISNWASKPQNYQTAQRIINVPQQIRQAPINFAQGARQAQNTFNKTVTAPILHPQRTLQNIGRYQPQLAQTMLKLEKPVQRVSQFMQQPYKPVQLQQAQTPYRGINIGYNYIVKPLAEGFVNFPTNYAGGVTKTGLTAGKIARGEKVPIRKTLGNVSQVGSSIMDVSVLPFAGGAAKNIAKNAFKETFTAAINEGARSGLKYGGIYGLLNGLKDNQDIEDILTYTKNVTGSTATGGLAGAAFGGTVGGLSYTAGKIFGSIVNAIKKSNKNISDKAAVSTAKEYVRERNGRFAKEQWYRKPPHETGKPIYSIEEAQSNIKIPEKPLQKGTDIAKKEAEVDPFLKGLEEQAKLPQNKYPAIEIPTDKTAKYQATIKGGGFTGKVEQDVKNTFANWVNNRRATKVEGLLKQKEFADLDKKGINGILEFQSGDKTGRFSEVKKYFDTKYNQIKNSGIDVNYKKNYLPQLWANPPEQVEQILGRRLSQKPSFSLQSLIKDYEAGIKGGLTPKFNTISQLVSWYERIANKTLADVGFFNQVAKEGLIQPSGKSPRGWKTLNPDSFPKISVNIPGEYRYSGTYSAPSELADMINNYLSTPEQSGTLQKNLSAIASFVSAAKNRMLSFGLPSTGINFHGFNILARSYLEGGVKGALKTAWYMVNPDAAAKYVEQNLTKAPDAIKSGLSFSTSEYANSLESSGLRTKFGNVWNNLFEKPLFEKIISANKLEGWSKLVQEYSKEMPEDIAKKEAAKFINTVYGGINWEELGRSRDVQNLFRVAALTPDWLESNLRLGSGMVKGLLDIKNPAGKAYRRAFTNLIAAYATLTTINKMISGHNMWENDPGHTFELEAGYTADGQKRYYRPFGTAADFIRLPVDIVQAALKGDFSVAAKTVRNRLSTIVQPGAALLFNVNWKGQPVYGKDKYGNQMTAAQQIGGVASELGTLVGFPSFLREGIDYATGKQELEPALTQGLELPFRYSGGAYSTSQKQLRPIAEQQGLSGEDKYNLYKKLQGQSKFSDKQMGVIQEGGLQDVLDKRQETALDNKAKKQLKESGQDILESNNKIYIKQEDGSIKTIDPTFQPKKPELTGNTELDKKLISRFNGEITSKANNIVDLYEAGKLSKDDAEKQLNDLTTLKSNFSKSSKPKTPKTIKIKKTTFPTIKISKGKSYKIKLSKFKSPKVKKEKVPKFKIIKPKRLKIKDVKL